MSWTEADSVSYQQLAAVAVPDRAEQIATLLTLLPFGVSDLARVVELGCGEGRLSEAILKAYPSAQVLAFDGSAEMRAQAGTRLEQFGERATVAEFELQRPEWFARVDGA